MAVKIDASTAMITMDKTGAKCAIKVGKELVLLHGTQNADLTAADNTAGGKMKGPFMNLTGTVFMDADASDKIIGDWEFGFIQVSTMAVYEFIYAGRMPNEGSLTVNLKAGFKTNPSLDVDPDPGVTIDEDIFDAASVSATPTTTPRTGFDVTCTFGDHPNTFVPKKFENKTTSSQNFLFSARRDEGFVSYFVGRPNSKSPVQFLSRVGWHCIWHGTFKWANGKPTCTMKDSRIDPGTVLLGAPSNASDPDFLIAKARVGPTSNSQESTAVDDATIRRIAPVLKESTDRPTDLPDDFYK
jgi:hypothetical protein